MAKPTQPLGLDVAASILAARNLTGYLLLRSARFK
jgi:hypothetical protein